MLELLNSVKYFKLRICVIKAMIDYSISDPSNPKQQATIGTRGRIRSNPVGCRCRVPCLGVASNQATIELLGIAPRRGESIFDCIGFKLRKP